MSKTIELTDEQWEALKRGESVTIKPPCKKWEPQGGTYFIYPEGEVIRAPNKKKYRQFGAEYPTRELAERAMSYMRQYNRLVAYALEHWPEYEVPGSQQLVWTVGYNIASREWGAVAGATVRAPWIPYGPENKVKELVDKLNRGEVEL